MKRIKLFVKLSRDVSIKYYFLLIISCIISSIQMLVNLYLPAMFVETITKGSNMIESIRYAILIVASNTFFYISMQIIDSRLEIEKIYVNDMLNKKLSDKIMALSYEKIENPKYLDLRQQALYAIEVQDAITVFIYTMSNIIRKSIIIIELFSVLFYLSRVLVFSIILLDVLVGGIYIVFKKYEKSFMDKMIVINRRFSYYIGLCFDETIQKDIRLYNMCEMLTNKVRNENEKILEKQTSYRKNKGIFEGIIAALTIIQSVISYTYIILRTFVNGLSKRLSYGQFTFYINAAINAFTASKELIFDAVTISQNLEYLNPYLEFMLLEDEKDQYGTLHMDSDIVSLEFRNVSFTYPETKKAVLTNVSFKILANEKISLVGLNGVGKSTIVKLICRLYKPTGGNIFINNVDIWKYDKESYDKTITTVFQDYKILALSILENISCQKNADYNKSKKWLKELNMDYLESKYANGLYTRLNKAYEDEGIDLSGGEKQKIAIARALYKGGSIFVLDEPTSSLDPKAETEIYTQFEKFTDRKMTIYISHRMSSSTLCDKILVLDKGRVIDYDTRAELIKNKDSLYYRMFMSQAENYID